MELLCASCTIRCSMLDANTIKTFCAMIQIGLRAMGIERAIGFSMQFHLNATTRSGMGRCGPKIIWPKLWVKSIFGFRWFVMLVKPSNDNELYSVISEMPKRRSRKMCANFGQKSRIQRIENSRICWLCVYDMECDLIENWFICDFDTNQILPQFCLQAIVQSTAPLFNADFIQLLRVT